MVKHLSLILLAGGAGYFLSQSAFFKPVLDVAEQKITQEMIEQYYASFERPFRAGNYLASRHAQIHHDWENANSYVQQLIDHGLDSKDILQRAMVLALGSGDAQRAISLAHKIKQQDSKDQSTIANILLIAEAIKAEKYDEAQKLLRESKHDATMSFIKPFLDGWIHAANGTLRIKNLQSNTVQLYHGILISGFLNDHSQMQKMIDHALSVEDITPEEIERVGDLYAHAGLGDKALELYEKLLRQNPHLSGIDDKIQNIKDDKTDPLFTDIKSAHHGIAQAFHDISKILYNEGNDETSRVFAYLALYIKPDLTQTKFLVADINARHGQYEEALTLYQSVPQSDEEYIYAQHEIATLYEEMGQIDDALSMLEALVKEKNDVDTLIKIGDLNRHQSRFDLAIDAYNRAEKALDGDIPDDYWHLYYVRGMSYEQSDQWGKAEKDLKAALSYNPDHPYVLNYLGYAWADQGINLDKALEMLQRASDLRPSDGYITDSLGWVLYRMEHYDRAVIELERAVELLPYDPTVNDHLGDAYWTVGRRLEAEFQWKRARNHSDDEEQIQDIEAKLSYGLKESF